MITVIVAVVVLLVITSAFYFYSKSSRSGRIAVERNNPAQGLTKAGPSDDQTLVGTSLEVEPPADLRGRVDRAKQAFSKVFSNILGSSTATDELWDELEETLLLSDLGLGLTAKIIDGSKKDLEHSDQTGGQAMAEAVRHQLRMLFAAANRELTYSTSSPTVWLVVGVNGVGKTTTIGKLSALARADDRRVILAAGDTFRAAAADQLQMWAERTEADIVRSVPGADPSSVVYDAVQKAAARGFDLVIADTAGRLHTKSNLMEELRKLRRIAGKEPGHLTEVLLVLDATTGQNGLVQARQFTEAAEVTGVILTKLDGSAKGGIALAVEAELGVPIKLVGVGEKMNDLIQFSPEEFLDALLGSD